MTGKPLEAFHANPVTTAGIVRQDLAVHLKQGLSLSVELPPSIASCVLGLPPEVLRGPLSILIAPTPEKVTIAAGTTMEIALRAFRHWQNDGDEKLRGQFNIAMFEDLYGLIQLASQPGQASMVKRYANVSMVSLFLQLLGEQDQGWLSILHSAVTNGDFANRDEDIEKIRFQLKMIYDSLNEGQKDVLKRKGFVPENVF